MIETGGERGSGRSVLAARHDDDDDDDIWSITKLNKRLEVLSMNAIQLIINGFLA